MPHNDVLGKKEKKEKKKDIIVVMDSLLQSKTAVVQIEGPAEEMLQQTKEETYERFQKTVQHALGEEVSWNHLAILFYTTKGVVSAVGKGSKLASAAKEMTLHYFSDKCAKWIMDQGGFVSISWRFGFLLPPPPHPLHHFQPCLFGLKWWCKKCLRLCSSVIYM